MTDLHTPNPSYAIELRNVDIFYSSFRAVKGINLQIEPCKITAIIGPSGISEEHTPELQSPNTNSYTVICVKKKQH